MLDKNKILSYDLRGIRLTFKKQMGKIKLWKKKKKDKSLLSFNTINFILTDIIFSKDRVRFSI